MISWKINHQKERDEKFKSQKKQKKITDVPVKAKHYAKEIKQDHHLCIFMWRKRMQYWS